MVEPVIIGSCELYLGDCRELLPSLKADALVTDPPYGIGVDKAMAKVGGTQYGKAAAPKSHYEASGWDDAPPNSDVLLMMRAAAPSQIIFGGNYFHLPPARCWLVWDKENGNNDFADCELAWTNLNKPVRRIDWMWNGMLRRGGEERNGHPTQKPLEVMRWCIGQLPESVNSILDPYMGSGTTGVAAVKLGKSFIGIEREPKYFEIARRRIEQAYSDPDLFIERPASPKQEAML